MFSTNSLLQGIGIFVCVGSVILLALVAVVTRILSNNRNMATYRNNHGPIESFINPADEDFGGVPTTGAVQDYESDYNENNIIGSSGFDSTEVYDRDEGDNPPE